MAQPSEVLFDMLLGGKPGWQALLFWVRNFAFSKMVQRELAVVDNGTVNSQKRTSKAMI